MSGRVHEIIVRTGARVFTGALDIKSPGTLQGVGEGLVVMGDAWAEFTRELQFFYKSFGGSPGRGHSRLSPPPPRRPQR